MMDLDQISVRIQDIYPTKAQFQSGEKITLAIELANDGATEQTMAVSCTIRELDMEVGFHSVPSIAILPDDTVTVYIEAGPFETAFTGYGAEAVLSIEGIAADLSTTAFDVVSDWRVAPRYGFLSDFGSAEAGDREDVKWLAKLHLNLVQFYDWMYRHDDLVSEDDTYVDLMGREVSRAVVEEKIQFCHDCGMKAMAYGAVYAASKEFAERHPDWRLYTSAGEPYDFIGIFNIMNIAPDSPWHRHIVNEYKRAVKILDFDGIHMDTYGFPKTGWSRLGGVQRLERLETQFAPLIEAARAELSEAKNDIALIFNNVGNWPVDPVARTSQDAIYVEVWKPYERYHHLADIIRWAKHCSEGKPVILAAYLKPFRELGPLGEEGAEHAFRLLNAVITANRAYHLLHGEAGGVLTQGYYVDHSKLRPDFMGVVRNYADFGVRYGHILYDNRLKDVSMTHADGDNLEYRLEGFPYSTYGEAGKVWTMIVECESMKLLHFINLVSAADDFWNEPKHAQAPVEHRLVSVALDGEVESVLLASPDVNYGRPIPLDYLIEVTPRGKVIRLELPPLLYWDMVIIRIKQAD
ncbi:glycoside hydrolase family 66 protein [Paenibacillus abyssi]|uniref:Cycloisomaltooligosaccharide glucanotransferase n=1 Tax=Paenibacillus abyssi TaxID=1340531 RepID=A0A917CMC0_9BACL|nr:glycoside hydrolase family 66 protein [Paenibacillus abyssi]GGF90934.1 cycloisomaltooligosaccharide glucanotransferase [Paenibacillus abyssi]